MKKAFNVYMEETEILKIKIYCLENNLSAGDLLKKGYQLDKIEKVEKNNGAI